MPVKKKELKLVKGTRGEERRKEVQGGEFKSEFKGRKNKNIGYMCRIINSGRLRSEEKKKLLQQLNTSVEHIMIIAPASPVHTLSS